MPVSIIQGNVHLPDFPPQRGTMYPHFFRSFLNFPVVFLKRLADQLALKIPHGHKRFALFLIRDLPQIFRETFWTDVTRLAKNKRMFDNILEFTNVSGIVMIQQDLQGRAGISGDFSQFDPIILRQEVLQEKVDILRSLLQRRNMDGYDIEPVV